MMYKIEVVEFEALRLKVGTVCTANEGQPCKELHGAVVTLNDDSEVMVVHAVDKDGANIIIDDSEIINTGGEPIADYAQWTIGNVKPSEEL